MGGRAVALLLITRVLLATSQNNVTIKAFSAELKTSFI